MYTHASKWFIAGLMLSIWSVSNVFAQSNRYEFMSSYAAFDSMRVHQLHFRFENQNFFRNNEFQSDGVKGYTLIGLWGRPLLEYYPASNLKIRVGGHFLRYHGIDFIDKSNSIPYYSAQYNPFDNFEIILGNFDESYTIRMPEMLNSPELYLFSTPAGGVQVRYSNEYLQSQIWLNWKTLYMMPTLFRRYLLKGFLLTTTR